MSKLKNIIGITIGPIVSIGFVVMGLVQLYAVCSFFIGYWGWHLLLAVPVSLFLAYIPLIGSICGYIGAVKVWGWALWQALLLFFWWPVLVITMAAFGLGGAFIVDRFKKSD